MIAPDMDKLDWDQLSIETPELVAIDMPVAGIGSRFVALLVDYLIWVAAFLGLVFCMALFGIRCRGCWLQAFLIGGDHSLD